MVFQSFSRKIPNEADYGAFILKRPVKSENVNSKRGGITALAFLHVFQIIRIADIGQSQSPIGIPILPLNRRYCRWIVIDFDDGFLFFVYCEFRNVSHVDDEHVAIGCF
tara:strand:+ start:1094 stop:1420 length:327 start_codon:yes stop_codon:yes gene_type:complete